MENTDAKKLRDYMLSIDKNSLIKFQSKIIIACNVSYSAIHNWRYGTSNIPHLVRDKICEIAGKNIFDDGYDAFKRNK